MVEVCSGDTDADGLFCCEDLAYGTYTYDVDPNDANYDSIAGASVVHSTAPTSKTVFLTPASDATCGPCDDPLPSTLELNYGLGTTALTYTATENLWYGCALMDVRVGPSGIYPAWARTLCASVTGPYGLQVPVGFVFTQYPCPIPGGPYGSVAVIIPVAEKYVVPPGVWSQRLDFGADCTEYNALTNHVFQDYTTVGAACKYGGWRQLFSVDLADTTECDPIVFEGTVTVTDCWIFIGPPAPCSGPVTFTITE